MNTKTIKFDLNKYKLYEKIKAKQGDTKSRFLLFQLLDGSIPFNLKNRSVRAYMIKPDGREIFNDLIVNNYNLGYCTLELTNQVLAAQGIVKIELMVTEGDKKLTSSVFELEVVKSINSEKSIVSTNEFTALLNGLAALSEYDNYKNSVKEMEINKANKAEVEEKFISVEEKIKNNSEQLDTKADKNDVVNKGQVDLDEMTPRTLEAIKGGEGTSFNLLNYPRNQSVNSSKLSLSLQDNFSANVNEVSLTFTSGGYYDYTNGVLMTPAETVYSYAPSLAVNVGEEYMITGASAWASNLYVITDKAGKVLEVFPKTNQTVTNYENIKISIPTDGTNLLINSYVTSPTKLYKIPSFNLNGEKIVNLKNKIVRINNLDNSLREIYKPIYSDMDIDFAQGGYYQYKSGILLESEDFQNAKIEVNEGEKYLISGATSWQANLCVIIDKNKNVLYTFPNTNEEGKTYYNAEITIPDNGKYMLLNQRGSVINTTVKNATSYTLNDNLNLNLKWVAFGDSLTDAGTLNGENNYTNFVSNALGLTLVNRGVGGTGYLKTSSAFWNRTNTIPADTDILTVFGSFNDLFVDNYEVGTINDTGTDTLYGAIKKFLNNCWDINPSMIIGIITPTPWSGKWRGDKTHSDKTIKYVETLIDVAKYYSLPCLNLFDNSNLRPWDSTFNSTYFLNADGTHPNSVAHKKYIAPKVENFIKSIAK